MYNPHVVDATTYQKRLATGSAGSSAKHREAILACSLPGPISLLSSCWISFQDLKYALTDFGCSDMSLWVLYGETYIGAWYMLLFLRLLRQTNKMTPTTMSIMPPTAAPAITADGMLRPLARLGALIDVLEGDGCTVTYAVERGESLLFGNAAADEGLDDIVDAGSILNETSDAVGVTVATVVVVVGVAESKVQISRYP
jgi:hypothetical protein